MSDYQDSNDNVNNNDDKGYKTSDEMLEQIRLHEPDFQPELPPNNVVSIFDADISNIIPLQLDYFKQYVAKPPQYVFYPCLETQGICLIYASAGVGKTLFALNIAYAIASGGDFLKYACPKPRKVLYIDGEMKLSQIASRLKNIMQAQGVCDFPDNLNVLTPDEVQKIGYRMFKIDDPQGQNIYNKLIDKYDIEVIVADNISVLSNIDENKAHEWTPIIEWFLYHRSKGRSVIAIHHAGKDKNSYRGSSRLLDCVDTAISLQPVNDDNLEDDIAPPPKKFKVVYQKARAFGGKDAMPYEVTLDNGNFTYQSAEMSAIDKVIECLNAGMTQREIAKEMFVSQATVHKLVKKSRLTGRIK